MRRAVGRALPAELARAARADDATPVRESAKARAHVRDAPRSLEGRAADVYVTTSGAAPERLPARYEIRELADVVTSHDPHSFLPRSDYPEGVQERRYHADPYERLKVTRNAAHLIPAYMLNTNPDSVNGPPVIEPTGAVLGGNSRAMSLALAYGAGAGEEYRALLVERAKVFGYEPTGLDKYERPVLVRVVDVPRERWADLSRRLNESQTQEKDAATDAVSLAARISDTSLRILAADAPTDETLYAFLSSPAARTFISSLVRDGVLSSTGGARYLVGSELTEDGSTMAERALVARLIPDAATIEATPPARREAIARAVPAIIAAARRGHDVAPDLRIALDELRDARARGLSLAQARAQEGFAFTATRASSTIAASIGSELEDAPARFVRHARAFAALADAEPAGQGSLLPGGERTTAELWAAASPP